MRILNNDQKLKIKIKNWLATEKYRLEMYINIKRRFKKLSQIKRSSLLAEALFLVFVDGRKETSAMGRKWLWFNRRPQPWTALFKTHAPCVVRWPQLAPVASRAFLYINSAVIYWAHIVNMACSKEFNRKELQSLLSSVLDNLDDGKVKKLSEEQFKALFHFLNGRDTFACLPTGHGKTLIYQIAVFVARLGNEPYLTWTKCH